MANPQSTIGNITLDEFLEDMYDALEHQPTCYKIEICLEATEAEQMMHGTAKVKGRYVFHDQELGILYNSADDPDKGWLYLKGLNPKDNLAHIIENKVESRLRRLVRLLEVRDRADPINTASALINYN